MGIWTQNDWQLCRCVDNVLFFFPNRYLLKHSSSLAPQGYLNLKPTVHQQEQIPRLRWHKTQELPKHCLSWGENIYNDLNTGDLFTKTYWTLFQQLFRNWEEFYMISYLFIFGITHQKKAEISELLVNNSHERQEKIRSKPVSFVIFLMLNQTETELDYQRSIIFLEYTPTPMVPSHITRPDNIKTRSLSTRKWFYLT